MASMRLSSWIVRCAWLAALGSGGAATASAPSSLQQTTPEAATQALRRVPPLFVQNRGQCDARVAYSFTGPDKTAFLTRGGITYSLPGDGRRWTLAVDFVGARKDAVPEGRDAAGTTMSWFRGAQEEWITGVPTFHEVVYRDLWPGIDLAYACEGGVLEYRLDVRAGADTDAIRFAVRGADEVRLDASGRVNSRTPLGTVVDGVPSAWQVPGSGRVDVPAEFVLDEGSPSSARTFGFRVGARDPALPLTIDPTVVVYGGYVGGNSVDRGQGIAVDSAKSAYVVGSTISTAASFTTKVGPSLNRLENGFASDAFVAKITPSGHDFVYVGYIAGAASEVANAVAVDAAGNAYVTGWTNSDATASATTGLFPVAVGPDLVHGGEIDVFVAKVNASGTGLSYCGYIGGSGTEGFAGGTPVACVAVDAAGSARIGSVTSSTEATFPVLLGPDLTYNGGNFDAFVAKVKPDGTALDWCGYIGGSGTFELINGIAVDGLGHTFVGGETNSSEATFPVAVGPDLTIDGFTDAFVARVKSDGTALDWCGYIGGSANSESVRALAVDSLGRACVAGVTESDESSFPVLLGPDLTAGGFGDAFVARVKADGTGLDWAGFLGGSDRDGCVGIAVDGANDVYVTGYSQSGQDFPSVGLTGFANSGSGGMLFAKLHAADGTIDYLGFLATVFSAGIAVDADEHPYIVGSTYSSFSAAACGPTTTFHSTNTSEDAVVLKLGDAVSTCDDGGGGGGHVDDPVPTVSYFLPKKVYARVNAKAPAKSKLVAVGFFDMGDQPLDLTKPATVTVGSLVVPVAAFTPDGSKFGFTQGGLTVEIVPNPYGSSRAKFRLLRTGDLTGIAPQDGDLSLGFTNAVVDDAHCRVRMGRGTFQLGRVRGALSEPDIFVQRASAKVVGGGKDALTLVVGLATDGTTPAAAADFAVEFGGLFAAIPSGSFKKKGDKFTFKGDVDGVTSVTLDYAREQITVIAKNADLGAFAEGGNSTTIGIQLGTEGRAVTVRTVKAGTSLRY